MKVGVTFFHHYKNNYFMFYKNVSVKVSLVLFSVFSFSGVSPTFWRLEASSAFARFASNNPDLKKELAKKDFFNCVAESLVEIRCHGQKLGSYNYNLNVVVDPVKKLLKQMKKIDSFEDKALLAGELSVFGENCSKSVEVFVPELAELFFSMVLVNLAISVSRDFSKNTQNLRRVYVSLSAKLAGEISKLVAVKGTPLSSSHVIGVLRLKAIAGLSPFALAVHDSINDICVHSEKSLRRSL